MPTISYQPPDLLPVRNAAWLEVTCNGYQQAAPVTSVTGVVFLINPDPGQKITITLPDGTSTVLEAVSGTPDDSGTQYEIEGTSGATIANLVATANTNHRLLQFYTIEDDAGQAVFTGRTPGADAPTMVFDSAPWGFVVPTNTGSNGTYAAGYQLGVNLWVERVWGSDEYTRLPDIPSTPGADGRVRVDLSTWLKPYTGYNWPALDADEPVRSLSLQRRYYWELWEAYGDPVQPRAVQRSAVRKAWFAGTRQADEYTKWSQLVQWLDATNVDADFLTPWLTYRGRNGKHEVSAGQQHYLGWYQRVATQTLRLRATVYYTDGTSVGTNTISGSTVQQGEIGQWPTGFDVLELGALEPTKEPYKYTVQLRTTGNVAVSELHTFYLVDADTNELHIEYINSFGVVDCVRTEGAWTVPAEAAHDAVSMERRPFDDKQPTTYEGHGRSLLQGVVHGLEVVAGHVDTQAEHEARLDILYSPEWRLVDHRRGRKLALRLLGSKQVAGQQGTEAEHLHQLVLQFALGDAEMAWSAMELLPEQPEAEPEEPEL